MFFRQYDDLIFLILSVSVFFILQFLRPTLRFALLCPDVTLEVLR